MPINPLDRGHISTFLPISDELIIRSGQGDRLTSDVLALPGGGHVLVFDDFVEEENDIDLSRNVFVQMYNAEGTADGAPITVPTWDVGDQWLARLIALDNGGFAVVWQAVDDIGYRLFDATGTPTTPGLRVNTSLAGAQRDFEIAQAGDGSFVVTWNSLSQNGSGDGAYFQRFDSAGVKLGAETRLSDAPTGDQRDGSVAKLTDGSFVGVWQSQDPVAFDEAGVYMHRYSASGAPIGDASVVQDDPGVAEGNPRVVALTGGGFAISYDSDSDQYVRFYDASGALVPGAAVLYSEYAGLTAAANTTLTALSGNRLLATWETGAGGGGDIGYRLMTGDGSTLASGLVHSHTDGPQYGAEVLELPQGGFVVAFTSDGLDMFRTGVFITRFSDDGTILGNSAQVEFQVNTTEGDQEYEPVLSLKDDGHTLVIGWVSQIFGETYTTSQLFSISTLGSRGDDYIEGTGKDHLAGWSGNDTIIGFGQNDILEGGEGSDLLAGRWGNDWLIGGFGPDTLKGGYGDDTLNGNQGHDSIEGGEGHDSLIGEEGHDTLVGGGGDDTLDGGIGTGGHDHLMGGSGNDLLNAWEGNDTLDGGPGADTMSGSNGSDTYIVDDPGDSIGLEGWDNGTPDHVMASIDFVLADHSEWIEHLTLTGSGDLDGAGNERDNILTGSSGANHLVGREGSDTLRGMDGDDTLDGGAWNDKMIGGHGNDLYIVDSKGQYVRDTSTSDPFDYVWVPRDKVVEFQGQGEDTVESSVDLKLSKFGPHVEHLVLTGSGNLVGAGTGGDNRITGNDGVNILKGFDGDDTLDGGAEDDALYGGPGADTFVFTGDFGHDEIKDFRAGEADRIDLTAQAEVVSFWDLITNHLVDVAGEAQIVIGPNTILLADVAVADIDWSGPYSADDFLFA